MPAARDRSANVAKRMAFAVATPRAMIAPMNDWRLSVVPVASSITATPASTAGTGATATSASRGDW